MDDVKNLSDITRNEWIGYHWMEDTPGDTDRRFVRSFKRTPEEAAQAMDDWDATTEERGAVVSTPQVFANIQPPGLNLCPICGSAQIEGVGCSDLACLSHDRERGEG